MDTEVIRTRYVTIGRVIAFVAFIVVIILFLNKTMNWDLALLLSMLAWGTILS